MYIDEYVPKITPKIIAKEKPLGEQLDTISKQAFKEELNHLSKDEILEKLLANYLRDQK